MLTTTEDLGDYVLRNVTKLHGIFFDRGRSFCSNNVLVQKGVARCTLNKPVVLMLFTPQTIPLKQASYTSLIIAIC